MAEQETGNAEETDINVGEGEVKKLLGLPQPLVIKIAAGLLVIILAAVGYLFLMPADEPPVEETASEVIDEDNLIAEPNNAKSDRASSETIAEMESKVMDLREQNMTLREENLALREQILQLETAINTNNPQTQQQNGEAVLNNYGKDFKDLPPIETDPPKPRPKPSWGEFKRAL